MLVHCAITVWLFAMEKSVRASKTILSFDVVKVKLFSSAFFTNQDLEDFKHFQWEKIRYYAE